LPASAIDLVCASISGMPVFDRAELAGIDAALGAHVPVAAPKALYGETFGASGALGVASALAWFEGAAPAPLVRGTRPAQLKHVLVLAVGFYGNSSALILGA
jgi:3-oxoacyl-[acyl-carrier-protein] synthase II